MSRVRPILRILSLCGSFLLLSALFQNCSRPFSSSSVSNSQTSPGGQDSAGGVDGKPYVRSGLCADGTTAVDAINLSSDLQHAHYIRQNCVDLVEPREVPVSSLRFAVNELSVFVVDQGIFATVKDGSADAPTGLPQYPTMLAAYPVRPNWKVAGVDYAVGPRISQLKNPLSITTPGVNVDAQTHEVSVNADGVTLDGYDFSLDGGWSVSVGGELPAHNTKILNSKFKIGSNGLPMLHGLDGSTNLYLGYCTFDSAHQQDQLGSSSVFFTGDGLTIEYSWFKDSPVDFIEAGAGTIVIRYNLFNNNGNASGSTASDWIQLGSGDHYFVSDYNTFYQSYVTPGFGTEGINIAGQVGSWTIQSAQIQNNTIVTLAGTKVSDDIVIATSRLLGSAIVQNNFVDPTGSADFAARGSSCALGTCAGSQGASSIFNSNINLITGAPFSNTP